VTVITTGAQEPGHTSGEVVWFDKFLEKFVGASHLVQVICVWDKPELEDSALLKPQQTNVKSVMLLHVTCFNQTHSSSQIW